VFLTLSIPNPGAGLDILSQTLNRQQIAGDPWSVAMEIGNALRGDMTSDDTQGGQRTAHLKSGSERDWYHFWWQVVTVDVPASGVS
jgi:hypothetical protein